MSSSILIFHSKEEINIFLYSHPSIYLDDYLVAHEDLIEKVSETFENTSITLYNFLDKLIQIKNSWNPGCPKPSLIKLRTVLEACGNGQFSRFV